MNKRIAMAILLAGVGALSGFGCRSLQSGSLAHPQIRSIAVGRILNQTADAGMAFQLRSSLVEELIRDASIKLVGRKQAQTIMEAQILSFKFDQVAESKTRADADGNSTYQTEVYRATVNLKVRLMVPGRSAPAVDWREVSGSVEFSRLPDLAATRVQALRQALAAGSSRAVTVMVEAW
jgi:hypothetical protein